MEERNRAKISNSKIQIFIHKNILWLDIKMKISFDMHVFHCIKDLKSILLNLFFRQIRHTMLARLAAWFHRRIHRWLIEAAFEKMYRFPLLLHQHIWWFEHHRCLIEFHHFTTRAEVHYHIELIFILVINDFMQLNQIRMMKHFLRVDFSINF